MFHSLSEQDKSDFIKNLIGNQAKPTRYFNDFKATVINHKSAFLPDHPACAYCGSIHVVKTDIRTTPNAIFAGIAAGLSQSRTTRSFTAPKSLSKYGKSISSA